MFGTNALPEESFVMMVACFTADASPEKRRDDNSRPVALEASPEEHRNSGREWFSPQRFQIGSPGECHRDRCSDVAGDRWRQDARLSRVRDTVNEEVSDHP